MLPVLWMAVCVCAGALCIANLVTGDWDQAGFVFAVLAFSGQRAHDTMAAVRATPARYRIAIELPGSALVASHDDASAVKSP